jgi:hypothetical protein
MPANAALSADELVYFARMFDADIERDAAANQTSATRSISLTTELPKLLPASLFSRARLTLLAELGDYKLWFPLEMRLDEFSRPNPVIGVPEVVDAGGHERSWRLAGDVDVVLCGDAYSGTVSVESISSTGLSLRLGCERSAEQLLVQDRLQLRLPDGQSIHFAFEPIRRERNMLAVRIRPCEESRTRLRRFLFLKHRVKHPRLYRDLDSRQPAEG